ncbi:DinB family protein [Flavivirga rizhaonensis]|uniref:DinB family protein n=1 Tax=Flavivirga rizhaonensis TaxID=2559571 RepID=A0A4S1DXE0_9FLAO|nr:DinB family protein [Flavivirga rizhaonensis]TGV02218.1 DinB family protein [Flavivirga rizhaonensis]
MKRILIITTVILVSSITSSLLAQQNKFIKDYLERLENSRKYLLLVAETMTEEKYSFKATPESMSFAENLMHIGGAMDWHCQTLLGGRDPRDYEKETNFDVDNKPKEEMLTIINNTFDKTIEFIEEFDTSQFDDKLDYFGLNRSKQQILLLLTDHITHHRGQMLVYLRLNGLVPPRYVLYQ